MENEIILESSYKGLKKLLINQKTAIEFILHEAEENVKRGRTNWLTNTITEETLTFQDIQPMSKNLALSLQKRGFIKGQYALYLTSNVTRIFPIILGIWRLGGIAYSSYTEDNSEILLMRIKEANIKWIFCDSECLDEVTSACSKVEWKIDIYTFGQKPAVSKGHEIISVDELFTKQNSEEILPKIESKLDDPILILCTSGTTGMSKGAVFTNQTVFKFFETVHYIPRYDQSDLLILKCSHVLGLLFPLRYIISGSWGLMMHKVAKVHLLEAIHKYRPRIAFGFPTYLRVSSFRFYIFRKNEMKRLFKTWIASTSPEDLKYDRTSLEFMATGGLVIQQSFYDEIKGKLPHLKGINNGFGMTEVPLVSTTLDLNSPEYTILKDIPNLTVGKLYPDTFLKVIDLDTGKTTGPNERGELVFKSPTLCTGYLNRGDEAEKTFKNGWIYTGDIGYYDDQGYLFVLGRIKETFKYFNNHISPNELEEIISRHEAVSEVCVFGVADEGGHVPRAVVIIKSPVKTEDILSFVRGIVPDYKRIRGGLFIFDEGLTFPKGKSGKVDRSKVAEIISNRMSKIHK